MPKKTRKPNARTPQNPTTVTKPEPGSGSAKAHDATPAENEKQKAKSGEPFEKRAQEALQFIHAPLKAEHDVELPMVYADWPRQFDVVLSSGEQVHKVFEAKDYSGRVPFEKVEAFETKVREMKTPPLDGAGVISSNGFQSGPIARARALGEQAAVRHLYHLREVQEDDWKSRYKSMKFAILARSFVPGNVHLTLAEGEPLPTGGLSFTANREASFFYDGAGRIKGNFLDQINARLRALPAVLSDEVGSDTSPSQQVIGVEFDSDTFMRLEGHSVRVTKIEFTPAYSDLRTSIFIDFSSRARDTLIDVLNEQKWIIPDPQKAMSASRQGYDVALTYENDRHASLDQLSLPLQAATQKEEWSAQIANAIQTQLLLRMLSEQPDELHRDGPEADLTTKLGKATQLLKEGQLEAAKALYWATCAVATSLIALVNLTYIYERENNLDQALQLALRTVELFPLEEEGFMNAAIIHMKGGKFSQAHEALTAARILHPISPELLRQEAQLLRLEGRWSEAAAKFSQLCAIRQTDAKARLNLAICESNQYLNEEAAWDAIEAFRLGIDEPELTFYVVDLLNRAGRFDDAVGIGLQAITRVQQDASKTSVDALRLQTAIAAYESGKLDVTRKLIEPVQSDAPLLAYLHGLLCYANGDANAAYDWFQRYVGVCPHDRRGLHNLSVAATDAERYAEAHAALLAQVFSTEDTREYWTMRAMAAARAGNHEDASSATERAASYEVNAADLLVACSDAAFAANQQVSGVQLRMAALQHLSNDGRTIVQQATMRTELLVHKQGAAQGAADEIEAELDRAERCGAEGAELTYARMLLALRSNRTQRVIALTQQVLDATLNGVQVLILASEAEMRGHSDLALQILDRHHPGHVQRIGSLRVPHPDAVRAAALLRIGRSLDEVRPLVEHLATLEEHPFHCIVRSYWCYGIGEFEQALSLLDKAGELTRLGEQVELPLRLQCLIEMGRYTTAVGLLRTYFPALPITACASWWSRNGDLDSSKIQALLDAKPHMASDVRFALQMHMHRGAEHVLLLLNDGELSPLLVVAHTWESAFVFAKDMGIDSTPVIVRGATPLRTIRRLRGERVV